MIKNPKKILIVRLGAIGDVVHVLPALRTLRLNFPDSEISWLVEDKAKDIITDHPDINEVIVFPRRKWQREIIRVNKTINTLLEFLSFYRKLRNGRYDLVIDFHGNLKSGIMAFMAGSGNRIGFGKGDCKEFNYLFTRHHVNPSNKRMHKIDKNLMLLSGLGVEVNYQRPELPVSKTDKDYVAKFIDTDISNSKPMIIIHPCTSTFGSYKEWPVMNYAILADMILKAFDVNVIFTWGPNELGVVREIVSNMKHKAFVACETKPIKRLIELIRCADLFISGDTGPLHIASVLDVPVVAIYGPKDPAIYGPYNGKAIVIKKELPCSPCKKRTCTDPECMTSILPEEVFYAVRIGSKITWHFRIPFSGQI